jgi:hypothetical protein
MQEKYPDFGGIKILMKSPKVGIVTFVFVENMGVV